MNEKELYKYLVREEAYDASPRNCYAFAKKTDVRDGISLNFGNMAGGFPLAIGGLTFNNSESAYIAGLFSDKSEKHQEIQKQLANNTNGLLAKREIRKQNEAKEIRSDFRTYNIEWMLYVVWCKCVQNPSFRELLLRLPKNAFIIEDCSMRKGPTATIWGCRNEKLAELIGRKKAELRRVGYGTKAEINSRLDELRLGELSGYGTFVGQNIMGKILMVCLQALRDGTPPAIDLELLQNAHIHILGEELPFTEVPPCPAVSSVLHQTAAKPTMTFQKGDKVSHQLFGEGIILTVSHDGTLCQVDFSGRTRVLHTGFAKLEKI